jgi:hypothetical protein
MRHSRAEIIPSVTDLGQALATPNDWRAIVIVMAFVIVSLMGFIVWREITLVRLAKTIDKMTAAMWAWRLALAEDRSERRAALEMRELDEQ